jgi:uncharacterized Zn-binding protein involved in type VI secretion
MEDFLKTLTNTGAEIAKARLLPPDSNRGADVAKVDSSFKIDGKTIAMIIGAVVAAAVVLRIAFKR